MTSTQPSTGDLRAVLVQLAGTPDESDAVPVILATIAQLVTDQIAAVSYASVTTHRPGGYTTVAASSALARAVDEAQYADGSGPCLDALDGGYPKEVPDMAATMAWPGFRDAATRLGLEASLSIPLFAGRGTTIAALNLYGHDKSAIGPLTLSVGAVYGVPPHGRPARHTDPCPGERSLVAGLTGAFAVRAVIRQAIGMVMSRIGSGADQAYGALVLEAAEAEVALVQFASRIIGGRQW